jgi:hypothetical protein
MPEDEQDLTAWAMTQAAALRALGGVVSRGENQPTDLLRSLDWEDLAEEIEGLARRDRRELGSRLALIIEHLASNSVARSNRLADGVRRSCCTSAARSN